jgi:hypothetical protein
MKWMIKTAGLYWPTMMEDYVKYFKGYEACPRFGNIQVAPASMLHPHSETMPFSGVGFGFHWRDSPLIIKRALLCTGGDVLLYQMDISGPLEKHDAQ